MRAKETLQLRHQLSASGLSLRAATYDTRRHHVLTFDSHPLRPHVLRLFSLRRELKSVPLFDKSKGESTTKREKQESPSNLSATQGHKRPSFFELQLQQEEKRVNQSNIEVVVSFMLLQYSAKLDVFICVYSKATRPRGATKVPKITSQYVLLLEPPTLHKLLIYQGPDTHLLQCAHYDPSTDRLVLASHLRSGEGDGPMLPQAPKNVIEILQLSKRPDNHQEFWSTNSQDQEQSRMLLSIENTRASLRYPDTLTVVCGSIGLCELYGATSDCSTSTDAISTLLEWRQKQPKVGKLMLVRRVLLRHRLTSMAVSPCGDWLLAGFCEGGLKVWNVNGSRTNGSGFFTIDAEPYEPTESIAPDAQAQMISSIEITTTSTPNSMETMIGSTDLIIIAAERETGVVRHWKFSVRREMFGNGNDAIVEEHRYPRLDLVGYFNAGGKKQVKEEYSTKFKNQDTLGPALKTLVMCVTIDMGSCFENLLLVVREDVIHVVKVQTVLYVMQEFAATEEVYAVRGIMHQDKSNVLSLSNTAASKLRMFPLDNTSSEMCSSRLFITPQAPETSAHVSSLETVTNERMQLSFVVLAWSSGVVNVYDVLRERYVMQLQDKRLTDQISALSVVKFSRATTLKAPVVLDAPEEDGFLSSGPSWSLSQNYTGNLLSYPIADKFGDVTARKTFIVVGTESGKLCGWNAGALWDNDLPFQSIQKANMYIQAAHSSHIVHLAHIDSSTHGERALLASAGAGGIIKLWSVPSLKIIGHINSIAEGYPVTPSCLELVKGAGSLHDREVYATVGYEDGRVAVWSTDFKQVSFQRLDASTKHERRVSKICRVLDDVVSTGLIEFLSCSLDMTVIQWQISGSVQEKRYFDIGAAIVDMVLIREQAVVALAHEICKFEFAPSHKSDMKYLIKSENDEENELGSEQHSFSYYAAPPPNGDDYPDTPTTRSVEDPTEAVTPSHRSRPVDEYLTLHVPSAVLHLESADTATDSTPATKAQNEDFVNSRIENADKTPQYMRGSKSADKLVNPSVNNDILCECLQDYIARHGTGGTMAANRITHLLSLRPELPSVKRPGFALAKSLKDLKLTTQARLDLDEALQVLRFMIAMPRVSNPSFDAPTMMMNEKDHKTERASIQRLREKKQARRKPVVTYNLLGEKYVRWEEGPAKQEKVESNQSPPSPTNSVVMHTPQSPNMRTPSSFEKDSPPDDNFFEAPSQDTPNSTTKVDGVVPSTTSSHSTSRPLPTDFVNPTASLSKSGKHITNSSSIQSNLDEDSIAYEEEDDGGGGDDDNDDGGDESDEEGEGGDDDEEYGTDSDNDDESNQNGSIMLKEQNNFEMVHYVLNAATRTEVPMKKSFRFKQARKYNCFGRMFENALVNNIRLSPMFQQFWTKGYCWCWPAPRLYLIWTDGVKSDNGTSQNCNTKVTRRDQKCEACQKRLHTIELLRVEFVPHYSRQTTFDIIVEVYSKLTATAHSRLYKNGSTKMERTPEYSIFSALYEVFQTTYGMRNTVEKKLKLFFVSMCHFLPEYDAIAVFGELLGLHNPDIADESDHAPSTLVAMCVCCYSWLYSRGMVINGDLFSDRQRGREWESSHKSSTAEVLPATDGTTHWQFVRVEHALLCAQDNLLYPLVSPGFLRNFMVFTQECAQHTPTRSLRTDSPDFTGDDVRRSDGAFACWIELHRFLRLLVGEWKHQNAQFRVVERLLFVYPQHDAAIESELLEKFRLMLSCFVFYDHERVGVMTINDFETLLFKLRYLWTEECTADYPALVMSDSAFENTISAIKKRFVDLDHDGQLCYLDFWVMIYIVGVKTRSLISFHEIPSFCRDYKLEVSPELNDMVWNYMQLSCTLLLPKGLQVGKSSMDQKAKRQHRRRVGGLHDGTFHFSKTLKSSLSTQELLGSDNTKKLGLFLDGSVPATRQAASTTALDRFRPVSVETEFGFEDCSRRRGREPVVVGIRSTGPTPKPIAPLSVSILGNCHLLSSMTNVAHYSDKQNGSSLSLIRTPSEKSKTGYTNIHIQFPRVAPVRRRVGLNEVAARQIVGNIAMEQDNDSEGVIYEDSRIGQEEVPVEILPIERESTRTLSSRRAVSVEEAVPLVQEGLVAVEQPKPKSPLEKRRSAAPVVVVPTVEAEVPITRTKPRSDLSKRKSSPGLAGVVSELIVLEETVAQLEPEEVPPPRQPTPVATAREETPREINRVETQSVVSSSNGSEVDADNVEQSIESGEEFPQEEVPEPAPVVVEEVVPEPELIVPICAENIESVELQPNIEEEHIVELPTVIDEPPDEGVITDVAEQSETSVKEEVILIPTPSIDEPIPIEAPASELDATSEVTSEEELSESVDNDTQYTPQVVEKDNFQIHNAYRFSQQPTFLHSVVVANKFNRPVMWNPNDDSDNDDAETSNDIPNSFATKSGNLEVNESIYINDEYYAVTTSKSKHFKEGEHTSASSYLDSSTTSSSSKISSRFDSKFQRPQRDKKTTPVERKLSGDQDSIHNTGSDDFSTTTDIPLIPFKRKRLNEDAERALYGERIVNVLGEGIAFSQEAEAAMQQKWQLFFDDSESKMFATMRHDLEKKQMEQREAEERQKKLRKKWQEQRDQDLLRLQHSRHNNTLLISTKQANADSGTANAGFRLRRIHRESCHQLTEELQFGVSVQRELKDVKGTQFFHFYYLPEGHGTIITLKMHVLRGDAEVFMSTDTKVPCATDFKWRSSERLTKDSGEGHRIILYPHDLQKAVTAAKANTAPTEQATMIETNSTASLRSLYPKQTDVNTPKVGFYLSVVALEIDTIFTIAVMSSGQKMEQSHAIQTVDYLIDRFNMISRSFEGQSNISFTSSNNAIRRENQSSDDESDTMDEAEGDVNDDTTVNESTKVTGRRRKTKKIAGDGVDPQELKSFQYLLETLSEKKGFGPPRPASILLAGPSEEHLEFVQDEDQRLQEMHRHLSPPKSCPELYDPISVVTERRLTLQGKRQKLRRVIAAKLQQKLAPLRHKSVTRGALEKSASTGGLMDIRLLNTAPRPVAYSITTLDPLPRSQRFKAANLSLAHTKHSAVIEKLSSDESRQ